MDKYILDFGRLTRFENKSFSRSFLVFRPLHVPSRRPLLNNRRSRHGWGSLMAERAHRGPQGHCQIAIFFNLLYRGRDVLEKLLVQYLDPFNIPQKYNYFCICQFPAVLYQDRSNHDMYFYMSYTSALGQWSSNHFVSQTSCFSLNKAESPFCGLHKKRKNDGVSPAMYGRRCEEQVGIVMASITSLNRPV